MRKTIKTILLIIFMWIALSILSKSNAATANISSSKTTATAGDKVTVTVSINAATWNLEVSGSATDTIVGYNEDAVNEKTTKTYTVTSSKEGTCTVSLTGDVTDGTTDVTSNISDSVTITFKEKTSSSGGSSSSGSGNSGSSSSSSSTTKKPTFKSVNETVYTKQECNLRSTWSTGSGSSATLVPAGTKLTLTGTSSQTINGYTWYRVTYNGTTKYIASYLITYDKPEEEEKSSNKNLSSLSIEGVEITPEFNKETTQYTATVDGDVTELKIDAKAEDSKAEVTVEGNEDLQEGDNVIKVKVTAEDNTTRTYFITVKKGEGTLTDDSLKLSSLTIERVNFEGAFSPDTYTYELPLNTYVDSLKITATPNQADATVEIIGNSNFQIGENVVTILVTSADGTETATYQIKVNIAEGATVEEEKGELGMPVYIGIGVGIAVIIIAIYIIIKRKRAKKNDGLNDDLSDDDSININLMSRYETDDEETKRKPKKEKKEDELDDFIKNDEEEKNEGKPKKPKGRHSM